MSHEAALYLNKGGFKNYISIPDKSYCFPGTCTGVNLWGSSGFERQKRANSPQLAAGSFKYLLCLSGKKQKKTESPKECQLKYIFLEKEAVLAGSMNNTAYLNSLAFNNIKYEILANN